VVGDSQRLGSGAAAVLVVNNGLPTNVTFSLDDVGDLVKSAGKGVRVRNVWLHQDGGTIPHGGGLTVTLAVHASSLLVLTPIT
jgi:hypothetical protein